MSHRRFTAVAVLSLQSRRRTSGPCAALRDPCQFFVGKSVGQCVARRDLCRCTGCAVSFRSVSRRPVCRKLCPYAALDVQFGSVLIRSVLAPADASCLVHLSCCCSLSVICCLTSGRLRSGSVQCCTADTH
uniref:(northern house mosquito) hypothetical protein n=1 Tax=Culex pipiens TaxID=7175 RepID=A0A8D8C8A0_CULPI